MRNESNFKNMEKEQYVLMMPVFTNCTLKNARIGSILMRLCGKTSVFRRVLSRTCFVECSCCLSLSSANQI